MTYDVTFRGNEGGSATLQEHESVEADSPAGAIQAFNDKRGARISGGEVYDVSVGGITQRVITRDMEKPDSNALYVAVAGGSVTA